MAIRFQALFSGSSGTNVFTGYTPETGAFDSSSTLAGTFVMELDGSGSIRMQDVSGVTNAGQLFMLTTGGPDNFTATLNFTPGVAGITSNEAITWRDDGALTFYGLYCQEGTAGITMARVASGVLAATLATYNTGFSAGTPMQVQLIVEGTRYRVFVNGIAAMDVTDSTLTTTGRQSLLCQDGNTSNANKTLLGDLVVEDNVPLRNAPVDDGATMLPWLWHEQVLAQGQNVTGTAGTTNVNLLSAVVDGAQPMDAWYTDFDLPEYQPEDVAAGGAVIESAATMSLTCAAAIDVTKAVASAHTMTLTAVAAVGVTKDVASVATMSVTTAAAVDVAKPVASAATMTLTTASDVTIPTVTGVASTATMTVTTASAVDVAKAVASAATMSVTTASAITVAKPVASAATMSVTAASAVTVAKPIASAATMALTTTAAVSVAKPVASAATMTVTTTSDVTIPGAGAAVASAAAMSLVTTSRVTTTNAVASAAAMSLTTASAVNVAKPVASAATFSVTTIAAVSVAKPVASNAALALSASSSVTVPKGVASAAAVVLTTTSVVGLRIAVASNAAIVLTATSELRIALTAITGILVADHRAAPALLADVTAAAWGANTRAAPTTIGNAITRSP